MLILTSNGLSSDNLRNAAKPYIVGKKAALVVTADNVYKEQNYHVKRLSAELVNLGAEAAVFDFDNRSPSELCEYGVVEMIGGNPFYLLNSIRIHGFTDVLRAMANESCVIGCSAGSFVMTKSLELVNIYSPEMNIVGMTRLDALSLTDVEVLPHYSRFIKRFENFESRCAEYEEKHGTAVIRLNDGDAVIAADGRHTLITETRE